MEGLTVSTMMLSLSRAALRGEESTLLPQNEQQLAELYAMADRHDIAHLVSLALYRAGCLDPTKGVGAKFQKAQMLALYRYEHQRVALESVCDVLEEEGIDHMPLKGAVLRSLYPEPWMRTSSDIDILIKQEDVSRAEELLGQRLGYEAPTDRTGHDVSFYSPSGVHVELHFDLVEEQDTSEAAVALLREVWSHTVPLEGYRYRRAMTDGMFYFYHIAHMAKHVAYSACGVRNFIDLWLLDEQSELHEQERQQLLSRTGLDTFAGIASRLSRAWFSGEKLDATGQELADYVLYGASFGTENDYVTVRNMKKQGKLRYMLSRIFMPYDQLVTLYPSLKGRRYLTFFYQLHRLICGLFKGKWRAGVKELKTNSQISDRQISEMTGLFERLGL